VRESCQKHEMEYDDPQERQIVKALDARLIPVLVTSYWVALLVCVKRNPVGPRLINNITRGLVV
jgi:hypothetical protein